MMIGDMEGSTPSLVCQLQMEVWGWASPHWQPRQGCYGWTMHRIAQFIRSRKHRFKRSNTRMTALARKRIAGIATAQAQPCPHWEVPRPQQGACSLTETPTFENINTFFGQHFSNGFEGTSQQAVQYFNSRHFIKGCFFHSCPRCCRTHSVGQELQQRRAARLCWTGGKVFMTRATKNHHVQNCPRLLQGVFCLFSSGLLIFFFYIAYSS